MVKPKAADDDDSVAVSEKTKKRKKKKMSSVGADAADRRDAEMGGIGGSCCQR